MNFEIISRIPTLAPRRMFRLFQSALVKIESKSWMYRVKPLLNSYRMQGPGVEQLD
jgi:hypothetical protein